MKILVIDDNPVDVKLFSTVLREAGHKVSGADAADAALAAIKKEKPQIILVDLALPGMDGISLIRKVKAEPETRDIFVVVVTGHPSWWKKNEALKSGCDAYWIKPVNTRKLPQSVNEIAQRQAGPHSPGPCFISAELLEELRWPGTSAPRKAKKRCRSQSNP